MGVACFMIELDGAAEENVWRRPDTGETQPSRYRFGPGAMWWAPLTYGPRPVERALWVILPNNAGAFCIDGPSTHMDDQAKKITYGDGWRRSGEPPNVTVTPSIDAVGEWHGWLTNGELVG